MKVSIKVLGSKELAARLRRIRDQIPTMTVNAVRAGALEIQNEAKRKVPKRTRTLSRSITTVVETRTSGQVVAHIGPSEPYGKYVEFGTGIYAEGGDGRKTPWVFKAGNGKFFTTQGMTPRPYLRPALDEKRDAAIAKMQSAFRQQVEKRLKS